jgi:soluble lytic murein transglycosylase
MPQVPSYNNFQVMPEGAPGVRASSPEVQDFAGQQAQQFGQNMMRTGDTLSRVALDAQDMVNQVRINDAQNQLREVILKKTYDPQTGYLALKGKAALDPDENGQALPERYGTDIKSAADDIAAQLGNDAQRRVFTQHANDMQTSFQGDVERHMLGEFVSYHNSVQDGTISLSAEAAKQAWNDPEKIGPALDSMKAAIYEKGRINGWSASQVEAAQLKASSGVHKDVIMAALENNNPAYAFGYLDRNKGGMTADDILHVQGQVNQTLWASQALSAVEGAKATLSRNFAPGDFDRMAQITLGAESGGKDYDKNGKVLTSSAGAKGRMQVLDGTNTDPGFGVKPAQDNSLAERARVGRDYLQAMLQRYGDPAKAWAAYNAGPGTLDKAVKAAGQGGDWLSKLPQETQKYVTANMAQLQGGGGSVPRPTELDFINTAMAQLPPGAPPQVIKLTREQAQQQFNVINKSLDQQGDNAVRSAQQWLASNNGNFAQLPPSLRSAVTQYAPGKMDDLIKYARTFDRGENQSNMVLYNRLASHPEEMGRMTDSQFEMLKTQLSQTDFKHFANLRADIINGKANQSYEAINTKALNTVLGNRLSALQIPTNPKPTDAAGRERVGAIQKYVRDSIFDAQKQAGRKFTPAELEQHVDGLFAKSVEFQNTLLGFSTGKSSQTMLSMTLKDLPDGAADGIRRALIQSGVRNPTNQDVLLRYWKLHG